MFCFYTQNKGWNAKNHDLVYMATLCFLTTMGWVKKMFIGRINSTEATNSASQNTKPDSWEFLRVNFRNQNMPFEYEVC